MGAFSYAVLDSAGKQHRGSLEADNVRHARQLLRDRGMVPLDVAEVTADRRAGNDRNASSRASLSVAGSALFTRQLATLIQSALPIADALAAIAQQSEKAATKGLIRACAPRCSRGVAWPPRCRCIRGHFHRCTVRRLPRASTPDDSTWC